MLGFHPFSNETKTLFMYNHSCFECGRSDRGITLHHNVSQWKTNKYTESPLNCVPLCLPCHDDVKQNKEETERYCLQAIKYLKEEHYTPTKRDIEYLKRYNLTHLIEKI